jgi:hypothetical protein
MAGAAVAAVAFVYTQVSDGLQKQADDLQKKMAGWAKTATDDELAAMQKEVEAKKDQVPTLFGWDILGGKAKVQQSIDEVTKEIVDREIKGMTAPELKDALDQTQQDINNYMKGLDPRDLDESKVAELRIRLAEITAAYEAAGGDVGTATKKATDEVNAFADSTWALAHDAQSAMAQTDAAFSAGLDTMASTIKSHKAELVSAWTDALDASAAAQEIGYKKQQNLADQDAIKAEMADRTKWSKMSAVDQDAEKQKLLDLQNSYIGLLVEDANYGTNAERQAKLSALLQSQALKDGLASVDPETQALWVQVATDTQTKLDELKGTVGTSAEAIAVEYISRIKGLTAKARHALEDLLGLPETDTGPVVGRPGQGFASGTPYVPTSGFYRVGERGPEEVWLPEGAAVVSHDELGRYGDLNPAPAGNTFIFPNYVGSRQELISVINHELRLAGG